MNEPKRSLPAYIILAMLLGLLAGSVAEPAQRALGVDVRAWLISLGPIGKVYIELIKMMAIPLVFMSIIDAVISTSISWRAAGRWAVIIACNTVFALALGLSISNLFQPGRGFPVSGLQGSGAAAAMVVQPPSVVKALEGIVPSSIVEPFAENNVLSVVFLSLLVGAALRRHLQLHGKGAHDAQRLTQGVLSVWTIALMWLVHVVPLAVFCVTARTVAEHGLAPFAQLAQYVALGVAGMLLQICLVYPLWIRLVARLSLKRFWEAAKKPIVCAFGTNSSLATVPLTLNALDSLGVSKSSSRLGTCIGTNFNNDGILLYEAMAVLFVAQAYGVELSLGQQVMAAVMSLVAAVGVAGVPEAGVVSLSLVLTAVGLPLDILPLLLTVDWIVARMRSVTNVLSDMTVSAAIDGLGGASTAGSPGKTD
jgi:DAACS family dicarboxylate/amino acid:cation (Na+ or H+) symporter